MGKSINIKDLFALSDQIVLIVNLIDFKKQYILCLEFVDNNVILEL